MIAFPEIQRATQTGRAAARGVGQREAEAGDRRSLRAETSADSWLRKYNGRG